MSWTKIDDGILTHPKMLDAEERCPVFAWVLWSKALVYVNQYKLDGRVTRKVASRLVPAKHARAAIDALVASGLWDQLSDDEFEFHNFRERNATAAERDAKARANADNQAAYRERQREAKEAKRRQTEEEKARAECEKVSAYGDGSKSLTPEPVSDASSRAAAGAHACDPVPSRPVPSRPSEGARTRVRLEDPNADAILAELSAAPALERVANRTTAETLVAFVNGGGKPLEWVLTAVREFAAQEAIVAASPDGPTQTARLVSGLRGFVGKARRPESPPPDATRSASDADATERLLASERAVAVAPEDDPARLAFFATLAQVGS